MRRVIIILSVLFITAPCWASDDLIPIEYDCRADVDRPLEVALCDGIRKAYEETGMVNFDVGDVRFDMTILPTERSGHTSVAIHVSYRIPPLRGFALSVYTAGYILLPDMHNQEVYTVIAMRTLKDTLAWYSQMMENMRKMGDDRPTLETGEYYD